MHEVFCFKNIVKCDKCKKPYDKLEIFLIKFVFFYFYYFFVFNLMNRNIKEEHFEEFHAKVPCECGEMIEKMFLVNHKVSLGKLNVFNFE